MTDFIEWLTEEANPIFLLMFFALAVVLFLAAVIVSVEALIRGGWLVPVLIWIVAPASIIAFAYAKDRNDD